MPIIPQRTDKIVPFRYTNRPETIAEDPTYKYIDTTGGPWKQNEVSEEAIRGFQGIQKETDPNIEPLSQQVRPELQNIPMDTGRFTQIAYQKLGGNPWEVNIATEAQKTFQEALPIAWKTVFPNIPWGGKLNDKQMKYWVAVKKDLEAKSYNNELLENEQKKGAFTHMLSMFEKQKRDVEALKKETPEQKTRREIETYAIKTDIGEQVKQKYKEPKTPSTAWGGFFAQNPNATLDEITEFQKRLQKEPQPTGTLTENQVAQGLMELAMQNIPEGSTVQEEYAKYYNRFRELMASGLSREDSLNEVLQGGLGKKTPGSKPSGKKTYKHLWD